MLRLLGLIVLSLFCTTGASAQPRVEQGVVHVSQRMLEAGTVDLDGAWSFRFGDRKGFVQVPGSWAQQDYPRFGVGIYEVLIHLDADRDHLFLRSDHIASEYRLLVDGVKIFGPDTFEADPEKVKVSNPPFIKIPIHGRAIRLTIEVSNQVDQIAGMIRPLAIGTAEHLLLELNQRKISLIPPISVFLVLLLYFFILAFQGARRVPALLLCGLCISTMLFYAVQFIYLSGVDGRWVTYIHWFDLGWIGACYFFGSYCLSVFAWPLPRWYQRYFQHYPVLLFAATMVLPVTARTQLLFSMHLYIVLAVLVIFYQTWISARQGVRGARLFLWVNAGLLAAAANDILYSLGVIQSIYSVGFVFMIYLMVQAYLLAERHQDLLLEAAKTSFLKAEIVLSQRISGIAERFDCQHPSVRLASVYRPSEEAGGDWIFVREQNNLLFFFVADVTHHGLSSALLTIVLSSAVIGILDEHRTLDTRPDQLLERCAGAANKAVCRVGPSLQKFSTLSLHCLEMTTGVVHYIQAGHMPSLVSAHGHLRVLQNIHGLLGHDESLEFHGKSLRLEPGSQVLAYTDGLTENAGLKDKQLAEILQRSRDPEAVKAALLPFVGGLNPAVDDRDDTTFIAVQWGA